jgi:hypothetical protein
MAWVRGAYAAQAEVIHIIRQAAADVCLVADGYRNMSLAQG